MFSRQEGDHSSWWDMGPRTELFFSNGEVLSIFKYDWKGKGNGRLGKGKGQSPGAGVIGLGQEGEERRECSLLVDVVARGGWSCLREIDFLCGVGEKVIC